MTAMQKPATDRLGLGMSPGIVARPRGPANCRTLGALKRNGARQKELAAPTLSVFDYRVQMRRSRECP